MKRLLFAAFAFSALLTIGGEEQASKEADN